MTTVSAHTERDLIARVRSQLQPPPSWVVVGIGDDAAVVEPERNRLDVLTVDAVVEGIHFDRRFSPPRAIGHRALAVNLSDLAAMGATPRLVLLSFALPETLTLSDFDAIVAGVASLAAEHRVHVVGGNLTKSPGPLVLDVTAMGSVKRRRVLTRSGARPGDAIYVTGAVGGAAAGLQWLQAMTGDLATSMAACVDRYLYPQPRMRAGLLVGRAGAASAGMDLSDGLADAVRQVAEASGVGATIDAAAVPVDAAARHWFASRGADPVVEAISGGDDYELLLTVPRALRRRFLAAVRMSGTPVTLIGACTPELGVRIHRELDGRSADLPLPEGFTHFR